ncbi:MAG: NADH:ubiquinone oxidoreductase subunit NDUFA12 [Thermohalobaculum sp.]|nr:NADH:ubiquinone oxidoreductase subunit NDUFA12 [Thermohalobaculum sp.]
MSILSQIFTWWNGQTLGTRVHTARFGQPVGEDEAGNRFYQSDGGKRRWVIYNGEAEASRVSPDWHGWLHHTFDELPSREPLPKKAWEKPHVPNMTGSAGAYHPPGSVLTAASRARATGDYDAWQPE